METTFRYAGYEVEVVDEAQAAKIADIVAQETYSIAALQKAAPGMMRALAQEHRTCTDARIEPKRFVVKSGKVKADCNPDTRGVKGGVPIGAL